MGQAPNSGGIAPLSPVAAKTEGLQVRKVAQLRRDIPAQLVPRQVQRYQVRQVPQLSRNSTRQGLSPVTLPGLVGEV